jgi:hypothetical protein
MKGSMDTQVLQLFDALAADCLKQPLPSPLPSQGEATHKRAKYSNVLHIRRDN